jgi:uncharacterized protein YbjT (DUF2867 family)
MPQVFLTGATGYLGSRLIPQLRGRGHQVRALVRAGSEGRLPAGTDFVRGDVLRAASWAGLVAPCETVVHLVGTPHPSPRKAAEFRAVDLPSIEAAVAAAADAGSVRHLVYISVAQPAPAMHAYVAARAAGEAAVTASGLPATFVRPWYVLGPGHRWPYLLLPMYALARLFPASRDTAERLGLVTLYEMLAALVLAVETPPASGTRVVDVPAIRRAGAQLAGRA